MSATQRKAWNEAMRSAGAVLPPSAPLPGGAAGHRARASDRRRRRDRARKSSSGGGDGGGRGGASSSLEEREHRAAVRLDALEGPTPGGDRAADAGVDDDDEYDEFADLDDGDGGGGRGRGKAKAKAKRKRKRKGGSGAGGNAPLPRYLRPRSLASILIEESSRPDSVARQYVNAAVRRRGAGSQSVRTVDPEKGTVTTTYTNPYPPRKFCPVTGLPGEYTEPKSGIPYASLRALEQIRERPPPWMNAGSGGTAGYWEAVKSLREGS